MSMQSYSIPVYSLESHNDSYATELLPNLLGRQPFLIDPEYSSDVPF